MNVRLTITVFQNVLGRGRIRMRNDVFELQIFVRLVGIEDLVSECGYFLGRRRFGDVLLDRNRAI